MGNVTVEFSDGGSCDWVGLSDESLDKITNFIEGVANSGFSIRV